MNDNDKIELLRDLLLEDDRKVQETINDRLEELNNELNERARLEDKVNPIITDRLNSYTESVPETLGPSITQALKIQIVEAQDEIVETLSPIMGKLIKKYVQNEMKKLSEKVDKKISSTFSFGGIKRKIKAWFSGSKESDLIIEELLEGNLEEVFVISSSSGILLGSHSQESKIDKDMISGMLTAIKSFVEDAFTGSNEALEIIEYETYKILLKNYSEFYVATVISGEMNSELRSNIDDKQLNFAKAFMKQSKLNEIENLSEEQCFSSCSKLLKDIFH